MENEQLSSEERQKCEIWTRVMGYYRPVSSFNGGKKAEYDERKYFSEEKCSVSQEQPSPAEQEETTLQKQNS